MAKLKLGDQVSIKLESTKVVGPYSEYTDIRTFDIIGIEDSSYYLYVPRYICVSNTIKIDNYNYKKIGILPKFIGEEALLVSEGLIYKVVSSLNGMFCDSCKDFCDYAAPNQGSKFVCWSCRQRENL